MCAPKSMAYLHCLLIGAQENTAVHACARSVARATWPFGDTSVMRSLRWPMRSVPGKDGVARAVPYVWLAQAFRCG